MSQFLARVDPKNRPKKPSEGIVACETATGLSLISLRRVLGRVSFPEGIVECRHRELNAAGTYREYCLHYINDAHAHPSGEAACYSMDTWFVIIGVTRERRSLMESHKPLQFKTFVMILIMIIAGPLGNVLLGKGMKSVGTISIASASDLAHVVGGVFSSSFVWLGVASLLTFFVANILVLSWADYSFVQPASSMAYGVVALLSVFVLGESVTPLRWAGIAIICLGVFIVGRTNPRTTEHR
jgi:uncharacterized membrane protein